MDLIQAQTLDVADVDVRPEVRVEVPRNCRQSIAIVQIEANGRGNILESPISEIAEDPILPLGRATT